MMLLNLLERIKKFPFEQNFFIIPLFIGERIRNITSNFF
jgi:hypothetical protein